MTQPTTAARATLDELLAAARRDGVVHLPELTDDQVCVLGGGRWPLTDLVTWTDWAELDRHTRRSRGEAALARLRDAGAVRGWEADGDGWRVHAEPALALVTRARARPAYAAFGAGVGAGHEVRAPRLFGIGASDDPEHLVLVEIVSGARHGHRLMTPARVARSVAEWMIAAVTTPTMGQQVPAVALTLVHRPGPAAPSPGAYAVRLAGVGAALRLDARTPDGERIAEDGVGLEQVTAVLSRLLHTAAPAAVAS